MFAIDNNFDRRNMVEVNHWLGEWKLALKEKFQGFTKLRQSMHMKYEFEERKQEVEEMR